MTNITELAYCLPSSTKAVQPQVIKGVPSLKAGETIEQAIKRREENLKRIQEKMSRK